MSATSSSQRLKTGIEMLRGVKLSRFVSAVVLHAFGLTTLTVHTQTSHQQVVWTIGSLRTMSDMHSHKIHILSRSNHPTLQFWMSYMKYVHHASRRTISNRIVSVPFPGYHHNEPTTGSGYPDPPRTSVVEQDLRRSPRNTVSTLYQGPRMATTIAG